MWLNWKKAARSPCSQHLCLVLLKTLLDLIQSPNVPPPPHGGEFWHINKLWSLQVFPPFYALLGCAASITHHLYSAASRVLIRWHVLNVTTVLLLFYCSLDTCMPSFLALCFLVWFQPLCQFGSRRAAVIKLQLKGFRWSQHDTQQQITQSRLSVKTYPFGSVPLSFRESFPLLPC